MMTDNERDTKHTTQFQAAQVQMATNSSTTTRLEQKMDIDHSIMG